MTCCVVRLQIGAAPVVLEIGTPPVRLEIGQAPVALGLCAVHAPRPAVDERALVIAGVPLVIAGVPIVIAAST